MLFVFSQSQTFYYSLEPGFHRTVGGGCGIDGILAYLKRDLSKSKEISTGLVSNS